MEKEIEALQKLFESIEKIGIIGVCLFVIYILSKIILYHIKNKKTPSEVESRNISRDRIKSMYDVITAKEGGVPVIYQTKLTFAVNKLSGNIKAQTEVLKDMKK